MITGLQAVLRDRLRLEALAGLRLLDTPAEEPFDRLTRMAARALGAPIALVSLVDDRRQFFKSACGLPEPLASRRQTPLSHSFCQHVVASAAPLVVNNALTHSLVCGNMAVKELGVVAYLGVPLAMPQGLTLGSFCVVDTEARHWTTDDQQIMFALAASVISEIVLRSTHEKIAQLQNQIARQNVTIHAVRRLTHLSKLLLCKDEPDQNGHWPEAAQRSLDAASDAVRHALTLGDAEPAGSQAFSLGNLRAKLTRRQLEVFDQQFCGSAEATAGQSGAR
jgi:signal transduction protein with GAF and PtsI domain